MAQQSTLIEDSFDRIQAVVKSVEDEVLKVQKQFEDRSTKFGKTANKRIKGLRKELRKYPAVKQAEELGKDLGKQFQTTSKEVEKRVESGIDSVLENLQIASRSEIGKLDKKLNRINRRLAALDKALSGASPRAATTASNASANQ